jgi:hypothetical protein
MADVLGWDVANKAGLTEVSVPARLGADGQTQRCHPWPA